MTTPSKIMIGADPEFFVLHRRHFISGHIFNCGTKEKPLETKHGAIQVDGLALECNVIPSETREDFSKNVAGVLSDLSGTVQTHLPGARIVARPSVFFGMRTLSRLPAFVSELGCTPDFDAYTKRYNSRPNADSPIRTGSGHIHIGYTDVPNPRNRNHIEECCALARQLDYYIGLPSLLWDPDCRRRSLYGRAGAFRPKKYGIEYRVPSNAWLESPKTIEFVFDRSVAAVKDFFGGNRIASESDEFARNCINQNVLTWPEHNHKLAKVLLA